MPNLLKLFRDRRGGLEADRVLQPLLQQQIPVLQHRHDIPNHRESQHCTGKDNLFSKGVNDSSNMSICSVKRLSTEIKKRHSTNI